MHYRNLEITFTPDKAPYFWVTARAQTVARASGRFRVPPQMLSDPDHLYPEVLQREQVRNIGVKTRQGEPHARTPLSREHMGRLLFEHLFTGENRELGKLLQRMSVKPLRMILVFSRGHREEESRRLEVIHALPWESLHGGESFLGLNRHYSVVRMVEGKAPVRRPLPKRARVLVVSANPDEGSFQKLALGEEQRRIKEKGKQARLSFRFLKQGNAKSLQQELEQGCDVLHFMGHGLCSDEGAMILLEDENGAPQPVTAQALVRFLVHGLAPEKKPLLAVLNACDGSAVYREGARLHGMAADLIAAGIPAVVAMRREILDDAAISFADQFYETLARGDNIDEAATRGRLAVEAHEATAADSLTPAIYSNLPDGQLFRKVETRALVSGVAAVLVLTLCVLLYLSSSRVSLLGLQDMGLLNPAEIGRLHTMLDTRGLQVADSFAKYQLRFSASDNGISGVARRRYFGVDVGGISRFALSWAKTPDGNETLLQQLAWRILEQSGRPTDDLAANHKGISLAAIGDLKQAEAYFRKAIKLNRDLAGAHNSLATLLWARVDFEEALVHAQTAVKLDPDVAAFSYNLARLYLVVGEQQKALALLRQTSLWEHHIPTLHELAKVLMEAGEWGEAQLALEQCIVQDPNFAPAYKNLAHLFLDRGEPQKAEALLAQALAKADPTDSYTRAQILALQVDCYLLLGKHESACEAAGFYFATEGSNHDVFRDQVEADAKQLDCVLPPQPPKPKMLAVIADMTGEVVLTQGIRLPKAARPGMTLYQGQHMDLGEGQITLVNTRDRCLVLSGPESLSIEQALENPGTEPVAGLFAALRTKPTMEDTGLEQTMTRRSQGGEDSLLVIAPRVLSAARPDLVWRGQSGATAYEIKLSRCIGKDRSYRISLDHGDLRGFVLDQDRFYVLPWPWPRWDPAANKTWTFSVRAIGLDDKRPTSKSRFRLLEQDLGSGLGTSGEISSLVHAALVLDHHGAAGALITARLQLARLRGAPMDYLMLARACNQAGLPGLALDIYARIEKRNPNRAVRIPAEIEQGLLYAGSDREVDWLSARPHFEKARSLYRLADDSAGEARVNGFIQGLEANFAQ